MSARLAAAILVSALSRRAHAEGGNAAVLARGDAVSGAILIACLERGVFAKLIERTMTAQGGYRWTGIGPESSDAPGTLAAYLERRRANDPDLWVLELDVPFAERLAAETSGDA